MTRTLKPARRTFFWRARLRRGWLARLVAALEAAAERRRQRRALAALDDRMLKDIGLSRGDIARETDRPCWRR